MNRRVLIFAYYFSPIASSGTFRTLKFVKYLREFGWGPVVITVSPAFEPVEPVDGSLEREIREGTTVIRARSLFSLPKSRAYQKGGNRSPTGLVGEGKQEGGMVPWHTRTRRIVKNFLYDFLTPERYLGWLPFAVWVGLKAVREHDIQVIYTSGPPFSGTLAGLAVSYLTGIPLVSDFRDPWVRKKVDGTIEKPVAFGVLGTFLERLVCRRSRFVINISGDLSRRNKERLPGCDGSKFVVITNGFDPDDFQIPPVGRGNPPDQMQVLYTGFFYSRLREPRVFLEAMARLAGRQGGLLSFLKVRFVGEKNWAGENRAWLESLGLDGSVSFEDFVPRQRALDMLFEADALLMIGSADPMHAGDLPAKLFEYLAVGKPILALVHEGECAELLRKTGLAYIANPTDPEAIAGVLEELVVKIRAGTATAGKNEDFIRQFNRRDLTGKLAGLLDEAARAKPQRPQEEI